MELGGKAVWFPNTYRGGTGKNPPPIDCLVTLTTLSTLFQCHPLFRAMHCHNFLAMDANFY